MILHCQCTDHRQFVAVNENILAILPQKTWLRFTDLQSLYIFATMDLAKVWVTLIWFFSMTSMSWCCSPKELRYTAYKIAQFHINYKKSKRKLWITLLENVVLNDCNVLLMFHKANRMVFFNDFNELMLFPKRLKYTAYKIAQFYINNKKSKRKLWITLLENVVLYDCNVLLMFHIANRIVSNLNQSVTITFSLVLMQVFE